MGTHSETLYLNGTTHEGWDGTTPHHEQLDDGNNPSYPDDHIFADDDFGDDSSLYDYFTLEDTSDVDSGATIDKIRVFGVFWGTGEMTKTATVRITNSDGYVDAELEIVHKAEANSDYIDLALDSLSEAWTKAKIDDISQIRVIPTYTGKHYTSQEWEVWQLKFIVDYTPGAGGGLRGPLGHPFNGPFGGPI